MNYVLKLEHLEHLVKGGTLCLPNDTNIALADVGTRVVLSSVLAIVDKKESVHGECKEL